MLRKRSMYILLCILACALMLGGCAKSEKSEGTPLDFTVVAEDELPTELKTIIDQKKTGEFKLTYVDGEYLYIAVGYGKQPTGGYSIQIPNISLTDTNIVFESQLLGPEGDVPANISYPYVAVKLEKREEPVIFQ